MLKVYQVGMGRANDVVLSVTAKDVDDAKRLAVDYMKAMTLEELDAEYDIHLEFLDVNYVKRAFSSEEA